MSPTEEKLISDLAHQAGLVLRNVGLTAELRQRLEDLRSSLQRLVQAQDEERRRLERNLHDGAQQHLVAIKVKLGLVRMQKYANASEVVVRLHEREGKLAFEVADDGAGFDAQTAKSGAGLTNMSDRVDALGGTLEVMSHPGAGTCVRGALPAPARVASLA
jgi:signal transduction histidine kinase